MARLRSGAAALTLILAAWATPAGAQSDVSLEFDDGRVTVVAKEAPLNRVLAEWQRLGGTRFVNAERLPGTPVTLTLTDVPERQALGVLLRAYSGYMASPRAKAEPGSSMLRVVVVMPTLARATPASSSAGAAAAYQSPAQPRPMNRGFGRPGMQIGGDPDADPPDPDMGTDPQDVQEAPQPGMMGMPNYPGMPTAPPQDPTDPAAAAVPVQGRPPVFPGVPGTATVPGMVVPATPPPGSGPPKLPKPPGRDFPSAGTRP